MSVGHKRICELLIDSLGHEFKIKFFVQQKDGVHSLTCMSAYKLYTGLIL